MRDVLYMFNVSSGSSQHMLCGMLSTSALMWNVTTYVCMFVSVTAMLHMQQATAANNCTEVQVLSILLPGPFSYLIHMRCTCAGSRTQA